MVQRPTPSEINRGGLKDFGLRKLGGEDPKLKGYWKKIR